MSNRFTCPGIASRLYRKSGTQNAWITSFGGQHDHVPSRRGGARSRGPVTFSPLGSLTTVDAPARRRRSASPTRRPRRRSVTSGSGDSVVHPLLGAERHREQRDHDHDRDRRVHDLERHVAVELAPERLGVVGAAGAGTGAATSRSTRTRSRPPRSPAIMKTCQRSKMSRPCSLAPRGIPNEDEHAARRGGRARDGEGDRGSAATSAVSRRLLPLRRRDVAWPRSRRRPRSSERDPWRIARSAARRGGRAGRGRSRT